jgi:serine/threonine protein kinase
MSSYIQNLNQTIIPHFSKYRCESQILADEERRARNVCACVQALAKIPYGRHKLDIDILSKLAPTVEKVIEGRDGPALYVRKDKEFPRKFYVDKASKSLLIISEKHGLFQIKDRYIKICDAVQIRFSKRKPPVARHVFWMVNRKNSLAFTDKEIEIEKKFTDVIDIISFRRRDESQVKGLVINPYDSNLEDMLDELTPKECLEIAMQLTDQLSRIHQAGFVHANIKPENVQITRASNGSLRAKFFNFRHAYDPTSKKKFPKKGFLDYNYGREQVTAPERTHDAIRQLKDKRKQAEAEDRFALGCLIIELQKRKILFSDDFKGWNKELYEHLLLEIQGSPDSIDKELLKAALNLYTFTPYKRSELSKLCEQFETMTLAETSSQFTSKSGETKKAISEADL